MCKESFEQEMIFNCAPTLAGIKAASMVAFKINPSDTLADVMTFLYNYIQCLASHGIKLHILQVQRRHVLVIIYRPQALMRMLRRPMAKSILKGCGYADNATLEEQLQTLQQRINKAQGFPHEIGIFLGYPPQDVLGFIQHKGRNFLYSGYWKVYANEAAVKRLFERYAECTRQLCQRLAAGARIEMLIHNAN